MKRIDVKFNFETPQQMKKRRFRRRMYRLAIAMVVLQLGMFSFMLMHYFDIIPNKVGSASAVTSTTPKDTQQTKPKSPKGEVLTDQTSIFYSGHSIDSIKKAGPAHTASLLDASIRSLYPDYNVGMFGVDVSHWQGELNWSTPPKDPENAPIDFVIVKATQGEHFVDSQFENNWNGAQELELKVGAYHFYIYSDDPVKQAQNFSEHVKWEKGMIRPIIDLELDCENCTTPGVTKEKMVTDLKLFMESFKKESGLDPIIYSYGSFYDTYLKEDFSEYDVWLADYTTYAPVGIPVYPNSEMTKNPAFVMWQFTNRQIIESWEGPVDANLIPTPCMDNVFIN